MKFTFKSALISLALGALASFASAQVPVQLNLDGCTGGCGTSPFATVTLTQVNPTTVLVTETLLNGDQFIKNSAGGSLDFNIQGDPGIIISNLTPGFSFVSGARKASTFGTFDYSIACSGCGPGASKALSGPLSFDVTLKGGGNLSISQFVANAGGYFFASDIIGNSGNTGNVGANTLTPEAASAALFALGCVALVVAFWVRKLGPA